MLYSDARQGTLRFQMHLLIETVLLLDPVLLRKYEACLIIGSILNFEALLGAPLIKTTFAPFAHTFVGVSFNWKIL